MEPASKSQTRKSTSATDKAPRKRRKRTVVSGAPDDCFTCARESLSCDRRRPYCSQCLDHGRECSGYKTKLTWGVGVASRGKLRGLSLPVTGSQPAATPSPSSRPLDPQVKTEHGLPSVFPSPYSAAPFPSSGPSTVSPLPHEQQQCSPASENTRHSFWAVGMTDQRIWPNDSHLPEHDQSWIKTEPYQTSPLNDAMLALPSVHFTDRLDPSPGYQSPAVAAETWHEQTAVTTHSSDSKSLAEPKIIEGESEEQRVQEDVDNPSLHMNTCHSPSLSQLLLARSVGRTPRLRYLISYYAEVIAPMIVAFDGPTNPFRTYVLRLAQESSSLQEAIATLSTSNIRQRHERRMRPTERTLPARRSSMAHRALTDEACRDEHGAVGPEGYAREEHFHRGMTVKALNMELADPCQRLSDSVLATLLVLCLFHICDTGVAQFKTQFAGVTKLLAIRMRNSPRISEELKWFIRMFTWFDTMTATTNDRESQLRGTCLEIAAVSDGEWGLENLAGCDPSLFKFIAQLGRLNLLSQNRETRASALPDVYVPSSAPPPSMAYYYSTGPLNPGEPGSTNPYFLALPCPLRSNDHAKRPVSPIFWAEWYSIRQKLESWRLTSRYDEPSNTGFTFQSMSSNAYISPPSSPSSHTTVAPQNLEDVFHISESFRHSAILYTERLAYPDLPSNHPRIQLLVHRAMQHVLVVKSDVYLLWPLFITGSECVLESHRSFIRERCKDISKDSGFLNNLSCLELLEKIWTESPGSSENGDHSVGASCGPCPNSSVDAVSASSDSSPLHPGTTTNVTQAPVARHHGFRWHQVMQAKRAEGEYMVL
ncbi:fungal-specific transcription factor domain-containing protein [Aspergillus avenaceus]|uniref:Fungal-specific transcription factor domain-containing protein n=1 Tax=Aspergillus avenaceus TaxID=36643 RepID=A0A5N6TGU6_ASPAV|nr:fungal-specific transcription factor domain-containing protein [Aspergillus avenaceus]